jgi:hypothetical protein
MSLTLADQQAALVAALAGNGTIPAGFDAARVRAAADALAFKRARAVAQAWPSLRTMLGEQFRDRFAAYAGTTSLPQQGGPLADGRRFARYLAPQMPLTDAARLQILAVDLHYRSGAVGLVRRRLPWLGLTWIAQSRRVVIALGARRYSFGLSLRR